MVKNGKSWMDLLDEQIKTSEYAEILKYDRLLVELELSYVLNYSVIEKYLLKNFDNADKMMLEYTIGHYSEIIKILENEKILSKQFKLFGKFETINRKIIRFKNKLNRYRMALKNHENIQ